MNQHPSNDHKSGHDSDSDDHPGSSGFRANLKIQRRWLIAIFVVFILCGVFLFSRFAAFDHLIDLYELLTDRQRISEFINSFGPAAPLVFMALQVIQVILAPIPGEATGFIGGYLFGALYGTIYSTFALTAGSFLNFYIGRLLGKKWVRKLIPPVKLAKMNYLLRHQGILLVFFLFLLPGFPKDYLCLFLGISSIPLRVFLLLALVGRLPGTLMLNLQGALVFERNYLILLVMVIANLIIFIIGYHFRKRLYRWVEKFNGRPTDKIDEHEY